MNWFRKGGQRKKVVMGGERKRGSLPSDETEKRERTPAGEGGKITA